jgi:hypothetical protein
MSSRSIQRRQQRKDKQTRKWAGDENAAGGRLHDGIANDQESSVVFKPFPKPWQGQRDI